MQTTYLDKKKSFHFIGIGGAGMSGLARILLDMGHEVTGSDLNSTQVTEKLEMLGAKCYKGHSALNIINPDLVVVSTAIPSDNPELLVAQKKGIPVIHRGDVLAMLMGLQRGIAVCGAHGKTTITSMIASVLEKNQLDPTIVIGGELTEIGGNAKLGRGEYLVAEADESDGSFLKLYPEVSVITNIEDDHMDYYGDMSEIIVAFEKFLDQTSGVAVVCLDDVNVRQIISSYNKPLITYGIDSIEADYTVGKIKYDSTGINGDIYFRGEYLGMLKLSVPGRHNLLNALAAVAVARMSGLSFEQISDSLKTFKGAARRFHLLGEVEGVKVVDDYAHHPSEIYVTLQAAKQVEAGRLIAVFQPHRYTRTSFMYERFGEVLSDADEVIISDIYSAGEKPIEGIHAGLIVESLKKNGFNNVKFIATLDEIVEYLTDFVQNGDLVLTMGAGNVWMAGMKLVNRLRES